MIVVGQILCVGRLCLNDICFQSLGVKDHMAYRTHDLRRGHALDLQLSGVNKFTDII